MVDIEFFKEMAEAEMKAANAEPVEQYRKLPFVIGVRKVFFIELSLICIFAILALLFILYDLYGTYTYLRSEAPYENNASLDWLAWGIFSSPLIPLFAYYIKVFTHRKRGLIVDNVGITYFNRGNTIRWKYITSISQHTDGIHIELTDIVRTGPDDPHEQLDYNAPISSMSELNLATLTHGFSNLLPQRSGPMIKVKLLNTEITELTHALKYHLKQYQESNPEGVVRQSAHGFGKKD